MEDLKKSGSGPAKTQYTNNGKKNSVSPSSTNEVKKEQGTTTNESDDISKQLETQLESALRENKEVFLNTDLLFTLHYDVVHTQGSGGANMREFIRNRFVCTEEYSTGEIIQDNTKESCLNSDCILHKVGQFIADSLNDDHLNPYQPHNKHKAILSMQSISTDKRKPIDEPIDEDKRKKKKEVMLNLFMYAILFDNETLAELAWAQCLNRLGAALIASALLKELSMMAKHVADHDIAADFEKKSKKYEMKACGVLQKCYEMDRHNAHCLLIRELDGPFKSATLMDLAYDNDLWTFLGQPCCQTKINMIWRGKMAPFTKWFKIVMAIFVPIMVFTIKFTTNAETIQESTKKLPRHKREHTKNTLTISRKNGDEVFGFRDALFHLYTAPISVFLIDSISYVIFLGLFSYFVCVDLNEQITYTEWAVWTWSFTMFCEEIRQLASSEEAPVQRKIKRWFASNWNKFDLFNYALFIMTICLRTTLNGRDFDVVRYFYSFTVAMYFLRSLQMFLVHKTLGPKVIMINHMMIDLFIFLSILAVFWFSIGVIYQASLFPNSPPTEKLIESIIYIPFWQLFGEVSLAYIEGDDIDSCTRNESIWRPAGGVGRCPEHKPLVPFLGAVYMFLTNILLVNLLIAMFSFTFGRIQERSENTWRFFFYGIVKEYSDRPVLCPPFIILTHVYRIIRYFCKQKVNQQKPSRNEINAALWKKKYLEFLEEKAATEYINNRSKLDEETSQRLQETVAAAKAEWTMNKPDRDNELLYLKASVDEIHRKLNMLCDQFEQR